MRYRQRVWSWRSAARRLGLTFAALVCAVPQTARGEDHLEPNHLVAIEARLAPGTPTSRSLRIEAGGTLFVEDRVTLQRARLEGPGTDYEGVLTEIASVPGLRVHKRVDEFRILRRGSRVEVVFVYAIDAKPKARRGGRVSARFELRERKGLLNAVAQKSVQHRVTVIPPRRPRVDDLAADFLGYRYNLNRAQKRLSALKRAGFRRLRIQDEGPIPSTDRLTAKGVLQMRSFERERRRAWVAHRHLTAASQQGSTAARAFLENLALPRSEWTNLPEAPLLASSRDGRQGSAEEKTSEEDEAGTLKPVAEYVPGSEGTIAEPFPSPQPKAPPPGEPNGGPKEDVDESSEDIDALSALAIAQGLEPVPTSPSETARVGLRFYIPNYDRSLVLDDPNIAHGVAVRASFAEVSRPEEASTAALFYYGQVGLTEDLGVEVTIPTQLVSLDIGGQGQSLYRLGNPLLAAKYRFQLPVLEGRRPVLTLRARWGIAATQANKIPASANLFTEQFSLTPNYADTYAFLLEKTDVGAGFNMAWSYRWLLVGAQFYADYLFPTDVATDRSSFVALGYGLSLGVQPFGPAASLFVETRAVSLVAGPQRTELYGYAGVRSRLLDFIEPAVWVGVPAGSIAEVTGVQFGAELRFSYDIRSIVEVGGRRRSTPGK